jgi:hypothetical protein
MVRGNRSSKTRGWISAVSCVDASFWMSWVLSRNASGASLREAVPATAVASTANATTGIATRRPDTPAARMAVISPSAAMRPRPIRIPTSTPNGIVSGSTEGTARANSQTAVSGPGALRTSSPTSGPIFCRKIRHVASTVPISALARISLKT